MVHRNVSRHCAVYHWHGASLHAVKPLLLETQKITATYDVPKILAGFIFVKTVTLTKVTSQRVYFMDPSFRSVLIGLVALIIAFLAVGLAGHFLQ